MKFIFTGITALLFLLLSATAIAQPLPCPPLNSTWIDGRGDTTICNGGCATITCVDSTSVRSTSAYNFSTIPYLPTSFSGGTPVLVGIDDIYSGVLPLPFSFCFYGTKYNSCLIGANGQICFNTSLAGAFCPWSIPGPIPTAGSLNTATLNTIMGAYYDLDPSIPGGSISWAIYGTAPCRTFVVSWNNVPLFNAGTCPGLTGTQQIVLYESTYAIDIFIHNKPTCTAWNSGRGTAGICDPTGTNYMLAPGKNATSWSVTDSAYRFTPSGPASWSYVWTDHSGAVIGSTQTITVCPTDTNTYTVKGTATSQCDSYSVYATVFINIGMNPTVSNITKTNPTRCGLCDGTITLHGLFPGISDTIYYKFNGVVQPYVAQVSAADSTLKLVGLCAGIYDSIVVKVGLCHTPPYGPVNLVPPPLTIGTGIILHPSACGMCDGSLTITGLLPALTYTLSYTYNGVPQPPLTITTSGAGTYTITNLCGGTYSNISASLTPVCTTPVIGPFVLVTPPPPFVRIIASSNPTECGFCNGTITFKGAYPYSSDTIKYTKNGVPQTFIAVAAADSTFMMSGLCIGTYTGFSVKFGPCLITFPGSVTLTAPPLTAGFDTSIHLGCKGDTVFFSNFSSSAGALYYSWNFGDGTSDTSRNTRHIYSQGTYTVTLIATNGYCWDSAKKVIVLDHPLNAAFTASPTLLCQGTPVNFTNTSVGLGNTYSWIFGNGDTSSSTNPGITYSRTGTYTVRLIATDIIPCRDTAYAVIFVDTVTNVDLKVTDSVLCLGSYITFTGLYASIGNTGVSWNFGDGDSVLNINPVLHSFDQPGQYIITVTPHYRVCRDTSAQTIVTVIKQPHISLGPDLAICPGSEPIRLADEVNGNDPQASWRWNTGEKANAIYVSSPGVYYATVNINNCYATDTVFVANDCYMNIPNVFTPNGDGVNDYFYPRQLLSRGLTAFSMKIYNRWGELVFQTTSLDGAGWDGKLGNIPQPQGVFIYVIDATFKDGQKEYHQGNLTLIR